MALHIGGPWLYSMRAILLLDYYEDLADASSRQAEAIKKRQEKDRARSKGRKKGR